MEDRSAFWDAVRGQRSEELVPTRPRLRPQADDDPYAGAEEAQVSAESYAEADEAVVEPTGDVEVAPDGRRRKLLVFIGVPAALVVLFLALGRGESEPTAASKAPVEERYEAVPVAPEKPAEEAKTPQQLVDLAEERLVSRYGGKDYPTEAELVSFLESELGLEVSAESTDKPNVLEVSLIETNGLVLLSLSDENGRLGLKRVDLDDAPE